MERAALKWSYEAKQLTTNTVFNNVNFTQEEYQKARNFFQVRK